MASDWLPELPEHNVDANPRTNRAVCRTDRSGYEARTPRHAGPRFYSAKRSGTLPNVLSTVSVWIAGANERHGFAVTEHLPIPFGSLSGRCRGGTLERLTRGQPVLGQIERHGNKLADLAHGLPSGTKPDARRCTDDTRRTSPKPSVHIPKHGRIECEDDSWQKFR
jgi:hypothetical protein